tara:strand:- start:888 stop:1229 length:342 start_codon:yes stop_codon:yes gene_type:complete
MPKDELDEFFEALNEELLNPNIQEELKELVIKGPKEQYNIVEGQEMREEDIIKNEVGKYIKDGRSADENLVNAALNRVNKRMIGESSALMEYNLKVTVDGIISDILPFRREVE